MEGSGKAVAKWAKFTALPVNQPLRVDVVFVFYLLQGAQQATNQSGHPTVMPRLICGGVSMRATMRRRGGSGTKHRLEEAKHLESCVHLQYQSSNDKI